MGPLLPPYPSYADTKVQWEKQESIECPTIQSYERGGFFSKLYLHNRLKVTRNKYPNKARCPIERER